MTGDTSAGRLPGDTVDGTDPEAFALTFVRAMRKERGLSQIPSLRTTIAIPRLLSARWFRTRVLSPRDYLEGAVLCTPPEDQHIAQRVAREILFPRHETAVAAVAPDPTDSPAATNASTAAVVDANPMSGLLGDLARLEIDLDSIGNLEDVDALLEEAEKGSFRSFDLYESLHQSQDSADRALGSLLAGLGGPGDLEAAGVVTTEQAATFAREQLRARFGDLRPADIAHAAGAGFGEMLAKEVTMPWELAGALAGTRQIDALGAHLADVLVSGTTRDIGRTLKFLEPHAGMLTGSEIKAFREAGLRRARDLSDHAELLDGVGRWITPDPELLTRSPVENVTRALEAARWIETTFGEPLPERVLGAWADAQTSTPTLETVLDLVVQCPRWEALVDEAYGDYVRELAMSPVMTPGPVGQA